MTKTLSGSGSRTYITFNNRPVPRLSNGNSRSILAWAILAWLIQNIFHIFIGNIMLIHMR